MNISRSIPELFHDKILSMPEYKYGVNRIVVTLSDGIIYRNVYVAWGEEIIKVGGKSNIPFDPAEIISVENQ